MPTVRTEIFCGIDKRQVLRNMVEPADGLYVFEQITGEKINDGI